MANPWLIGYAYRKAINIGKSAGAGTDYQVKVIVQPGAGTDGTPAGTVYLNSKSAFFPNDIAFTDDSGNILKYWYEYDSNNFWVKVTATLESNATIYLYYGNTSVLPNPVDVPGSAVWKRYGSNPVLVVGANTTWDDFWVGMHSIWKEGSIYYGYYTGQGGDSVYRTGLATSSDGVTWNKDVSWTNPIIPLGSAGDFDDACASGPVVWKEGTTWYMLYAGKKASTGIWSIGLATSADGISWTKDTAHNPVMSGDVGAWDATIVAPGTNIVKEGSTYYLYYTGWATTSQSTSQIGLATSTNLTSWSKSGNNPLIVPAGSGTEIGAGEAFVKKFGSTYYMWYQATGDDANMNRSRVFFASSSAKDSGWNKDSSNPILNNAQDSWDSFWTEIPVLIQVGNEWRMYYNGSNGSAATPRSQGGYATYTVVGDGPNTFLFFDDFYTLNTASKWTNSGSFVFDHGGVEKYASNTNTNYRLKSQASFAYPLAIHTRVKVGSDYSAEYGDEFGVLFDDGNYNHGHWAAHSTGSTPYDWSGVGKYGGTYNKTDESITANTYYKLALRIASTNQYGMINDVQKGSTAQSPQWASASIVLHTGRTSGTSAYTTYFEWVFVRKYLVTEPAISSFGSEQNWFLVKESSAWKNVSQFLITIGGAWKNLSSIKIAKGSAWKDLS